MSRVRHGGLASNPSASKAETFVRCPASHVLNQAPEDTEQAARGTGGHQPLTDAINGTGDMSPEMRSAMTGLLHELMEGVENRSAEAAYVVNVQKRTSRLVGFNIGRNYGSLAPYELGVSLDAQGVISDDVAWVRDWKFGTYSSEWQLAVQAMAVLFRNKSQVMVDGGFVYMDIDNDGIPYNPKYELYSYGRMDLEDRADELVYAFDKVKDIAALLKSGGIPQLRQGPWCKYCPAQPTCPAKWSMIRAAMGELKPLEGMVEAMTLEKCGEAWTWIKEIERFTKAAEKTLKERLYAAGSIPLPNGKHLVLEHRNGRESLDKKKTFALLDEVIMMLVDNQAIDEDLHKQLLSRRGGLVTLGNSYTQTAERKQ